MTAEISFDLKMKDEMDFVEGVYRLPEQDWRIFIFIRRPIAHPQIKADIKWESGAIGINVFFPKNDRLNKAIALQLLSGYLGVSEWREVKGPNSMNLR